MFDQLEKIILLKTNLKKTSHLIGKAILLIIFFQVIVMSIMIFPTSFFIVLGNFIFSLFLWRVSQKSFNICFAISIVFFTLLCLFLRLNLFFLFSLIMLLTSAFIILHFSKKYKKLLFTLISGLFFSIATIALIIKSCNFNIFSIATDLSMFYIILAFTNMFSMTIPAFYLLSKQNYKKNEILFPKKIGFKNTFNVVFFGLLLCFFAQITSVLFQMLLELLDFKLKKTDLPIDLSNPLSIFLFFISVSFVPAVAEELVFRGVILNFLKKYGYKFAIFTQALLFGIIHINIFQIIFAFIVGLILGFILIKTKSIFPGLIIHFLNNFIACVLTLCEKTDKNLYFLANSIIWSIILFLGLMSTIIILKEDKNFFRLKNSSILKTNISLKTFMSSKFVICSVCLICFLILVNMAANRI